MLRLLTPAEGNRRPWDTIDRTLLDITAEGCWIVDRNLITTFANRALCALLGYREEELVGSHLLQFVDDEGRRLLQRHVALRDVLPHHSYDLTLIRSDGAHVHAIFTLTAIGDDTGFEGGSIAFVTDITQRRNLELQLQLQRRQLDETLEGMKRFFAIVAQDIKDPLSAVLGFTDALSSNTEDLSDDDVRAYAVLCNDAGKHLMRLLDNLSLWSKLQLDQVPVEPRSYQLGGLLQDILGQIEPPARRKGVTIVNTIFTHHVYADLRLTDIILRNLIDNAVKYSNSGSVVMLRSRESGPFVDIFVEDTGIGIAPSVLPTLFRIDRHHATPGTGGEVGSGLGLLLCRALTEKQGGTLTLESRLGAGTTVRFTLPTGSRESEPDEF